MYENKSSVVIYSYNISILAYGSRGIIVHHSWTGNRNLTHKHRAERANRKWYNAFCFLVPRG